MATDAVTAIMNDHRVMEELVERMRTHKAEQLLHQLEETGPELSRDELYEKAKQADVPGRSSMTKEELAHAVDKSR